MSEVATYQDAYQKLLEKVYIPTFFTKLASAYGIQPANDEESSELLTMSGKLRQAEENERTKTASERTSLLAEAHRDLDKVIGLPASSVSPSEDAAVKQAAASLTGNQEMRDAALIYADFLAQMKTANSK